MIWGFSERNDISEIQKLLSIYGLKWTTLILDLVRFIHSGSEHFLKREAKSKRNKQEIFPCIVSVVNDDKADQISSLIVPPQKIV